MTTAEKKKPAPVVSTHRTERLKQDKSLKILQKDFLQGSFAYNRWSVTLPLGWDFKETLNPEFWSNVAHMLAANPASGQKSKVGDIIEVRTIDSRFYAELYVRAVREQALVVSILREPVVFTEGWDNKTANMTIRFNAGKRQHEVVRDSDGVVIGEGFDLLESAVTFIQKLEG